MSKTRYRNNIPPGLMAQIFFAVIITIGALLVLPTALSAKQAGALAPDASVAMPSAGSVSTSVQDFHAGSFAATDFSDWD